MDKTIQGRFYQQLEKAPGRHALTYVDSQGAFAWRSLEEVYQWAGGYCTRLTELGLRRRDVCVLALQSDEYCLAMLTATLLLGAVPILIAPPIIQARGRFSNLTQVLRRVIRKTKPRLVIAHEAMADMHHELAKGLKGVGFVFGSETLNLEICADLPRHRIPATDIAALQLTSGTTGFPRVCVWQQEKVVAALDGMALAMNLSRDDICLNWTPLYHDMGLANNFLLCLTKGVPLAMMNPMDFVRRPALWLRALSDTHATITWSPNFGFAITTERVRDGDIQGVRLDRVRGFWNAAERIHMETMERFYQRFAPFGLRRHALQTNYGCVENIGGATFSDANVGMVAEHIDEQLIQQQGIARPIASSDRQTQGRWVVSAGRPCPGIRIQILSRHGHPLPDGHIGEVALHTPSRMGGYLRDVRATRRTLYGDLVRTGDLGYMRDNHLFWVGRLRERITTFGRKLDPSDFERILFTIPELRHGCFAAFGVDDAKFGTQRVVVVTEVRDRMPRTYQDIVNHIRSQIFLCLGVTVDQVLLVQEGTLTKTSSGKRRHRHFRQMFLNGDLKSLPIPKTA